MDSQRAAQLRELFVRDGFDALICRTPQHVLMLTGYLPVLGNTFCLISLARQSHPEIRLALPGAERDLLPDGTAVAVESYEEETLQYVQPTLEAVRDPLRRLLEDAGLRGEAVVGYEADHAPVATAYTQVAVAGSATLDLYHRLLPRAHFRDVTPLLRELGAVKTPSDLAAIRRCVQVALKGFDAARAAVRMGATEADVAAAALGAMMRAGHAVSRTHQVLPHVHVMAGKRAAEAYKAFDLTSNATIARGDPAVVQIEAGVDGYWAELTRTFFAGTISDEWRRAHEACLDAHAAALRTIHNGTVARDADLAAREVMRQAGFGDAFKTPLGHGVGFQAINHAAPPVVHPMSDTVLRAGMVHNLEPGVYLEGKGGVRLNDDVAVQPDGAELLSQDLPRDLDWLVAPE